MTVAHPSKYFTSTQKKLIQLELMLFGGGGHCVIVICVFSQVFCWNLFAKRDLVSSFYINISLDTFACFKHILYKFCLPFVFNISQI